MESFHYDQHNGEIWKDFHEGIAACQRSVKELQKNLAALSINPYKKNEIFAAMQDKEGFHTCYRAIKTKENAGRILSAET